MLWYSLMLLGTFPCACGNVYKQHVLQDKDVDIMFASYMSGNFQVFWGLVFFWVLWIPLPGQRTILPSDTLSIVADTWSCMQGNIPHQGDESCAEGALPPMFWFQCYL